MSSTDAELLSNSALQYYISNDIENFTLTIKDIATFIEISYKEYLEIDDVIRFIAECICNKNDPNQNIYLNIILNHHSCFRYFPFDWNICDYQSDEHVTDDFNNQHIPLLVRATKSGNIEAIKLMMNSPFFEFELSYDDTNYTAIDASCENNNIEIFKILLDYFYKTDISSYNEIHIIILNRCEAINKPAFFTALINHDFKLIQETNKSYNFQLPKLIKNKIKFYILANEYPFFSVNVGYDIYNILPHRLNYISMICEYEYDKNCVNTEDNILINFSNDEQISRWEILDKYQYIVKLKNYFDSFEYINCELIEDNIVALIIIDKSCKESFLKIINYWFGMHGLLHDIIIKYDKNNIIYNLQIGGTFFEPKCAKCMSCIVVDDDNEFNGEHICRNC